MLCVCVCVCANRYMHNTIKSKNKYTRIYVDQFFAACIIYIIIICPHIKLGYFCYAAAAMLCNDCVC